MTGGNLKRLQTADRLFGPWLFRLLQPAARKRSAGSNTGRIPPGDVRGILIIRPGGLGDAALTFPMLAALRNGFPDARIDILAERRNAGVYALADGVGEIYCYDAGAFGVMRRLRRSRYDLIIDTEQYHHFSTACANFLRPTYLCGFATLGRERFLTHAVAYSEDAYEAASFLNLAEIVTGSATPFDPDRAFIDVPSQDAFWAEAATAAAADRRIVAVTPIAGGRSRLWPVERYAEVVRWLTSREYYVVLLGGQDGIEAANSVSAKQDPAAILNLAGKTSLAQSAAVLQRASLSISADTGVLHLAYGVGTPTVSLFGSGLHLKWGPPGRRHRIVRKELPCSPCIEFGRLPPCAHAFACMRDLGAGDVIAAMDALLAE